MKRFLQTSIFICTIALITIPLLPMSGAVLGYPDRNQCVWSTGYWQNANSLNPWAANPAFGIAQMYETLFGFNAETGTIIPVIGTSYWWNPSNTSECIVNLNTAAKFSDGSSVTPEDVVYSYELAMWNSSNFGPDMRFRLAGGQDPSPTAPGSTTPFIACTKLNSTAVKFATDDAFHHTGFLDTWLRSNVPIIKKTIWQNIMASQVAAGKALDDFTNDWFSPSFNSSWEVSSGSYFPFMRTDSGNTEIYKLRSDWWGAGIINLDLPQTQGTPQVPYIGLQHYSGNDAQNIAFLQGEIDFFGGYMANIWEAQAAYPTIGTWFGNQAPYELGASSMVELVPNWNYFPFNQLWFRKALAYGINYTDCSQTGASGYLQRARQGFVDDRIAPLKPIYNSTIQSLYGIDYSITSANTQLATACHYNTTTKAWYTNDVTGDDLFKIDAATNLQCNDPGADAELWNPGINIKLGPYPCITVVGWTDVDIATELWCDSFTNNLHIETVYTEVDYGTMDAAFRQGTFKLGMMCSSPKLMNNPVVFLNGYRGAIFEEGGQQFNRNTSNWYGAEAAAFETAFQEFEVATPGSAAYLQDASTMQYLLATTIPTIPLYGNGYWYAFDTTYWTGWVTEANKYNQITTCWDNDNMAIRTRLIHNLIPTGAQPDWLPWIFGFIAIGAIAALVATVIVMRRRSK